jgi:tetratricopeptide (TPR) repeat protein
MSSINNPGVLRRFIKYMAIATFVMFTVWAIARQVEESPDGDYEVRQGDIFLSDGKYDEAIKAFDEALNLQPNHRGAWMGKAVAHLQQGHAKLAEDEFSAIINFLKETLVVDDVTGYGALSAAYANRAIIKDRQGRYKEALDDYVLSVKADADLGEGPGVIAHILYYDRKPSSIIDRAKYIYVQLQKPESERLMRVPELDANQRMYKP